MSHTNFLYRFEAGSGAVYRFTNIAFDQVYDGENYIYTEIEHSAPTFSEEASDDEVGISVAETNEVVQLFGDGPPPYPIKVLIYEYDRETEVATPYYRGWIIRPGFSLTESTVVLYCKSVWHFFERDSFVDSLSVLSRYSVFDPRAGIDIEAFRVAIVVTALNDERDVLTVTGITEPDDWFKAGIIMAPDGDKRTILQHVTESGDKKLYLNKAFPAFTLAAGFPAAIYPGDDLTYTTWAVKFGAVTNNGEAHGGWPFMPNVDPEKRGVI